MPAKRGSGNRIKPRFLKGYCRNELPAREGIDTVLDLVFFLFLLHRRNELPAREGIDT